MPENWFSKNAIPAASAAQPPAPPKARDDGWFAKHDLILPVRPPLPTETPLRGAELGKQLASTIPIAGAIVGSAAGPVGTAIGAGAGRALQISAETLLDPAEQQKRAGLAGAAQTLRDVATTGAVQGAMDAGVGLLAKGGGWLGKRYLNRYIRPGSEKARAAASVMGTKLTAYEKVGVPITRSEIASHNVSKAMQKSLDELGQPVGMIKSGEKVADAIETADANFERIFHTDYQALDQAAEVAAGPPVKLALAELPSELKAARRLRLVGETSKPAPSGRVSADMIRDTFARSTPSTQASLRQEAPFSQAPGAFANDVERDIANLSDLKFNEAQALRSDWLRKGREAGTSEAGMTANRGALAIDRAMDAAAKKISPEFHKQWRELNQGYKEGRQLFDSTFMANALKRDPEALINAVGNNQPSKALRIREALQKYGGQQGDEALGAFQRSYAEKLVADPSKLPQLMDKAGNETLEAVFGGRLQGQATLKNLHQASDVMRQVVASDTSKQLSLHMSEGFRAGVNTYFRVPKELLDKAGSWVFVKIMENPTASKIFIDGMVAAPQSFATYIANTERAVALATKGGRLVHDTPFMSTLDRVFSLGGNIQEYQGPGEPVRKQPLAPAPTPTPMPTPTPSPYAAQ